MEKLNYLFTHHAVLPESVMWVVFGIAVIILLLWDLLFLTARMKFPTLRTP